MSAKHSSGNRSGIPAACYIRMSSDKQDASPQQQRDEVAKLAARGGYHLIVEYADEAVSGDQADKRHGFQRMIADAVAGKFKAILCWDQDRFGRFDSVEAGFWIHPLRKAGVKLVTVAQGVVDWSDFAGRLIYNVQQEAKHAYLRDLSRNTLRGKLAAAKRGDWLGKRPLGYHVENRRLVVGDPQVVQIVIGMFRDYLNGHSLRAIALNLNQAGIKTQRGNHWKAGSVKDVLGNPAYIGCFRWNVKPREKYHCVRDGEILTAGSPGGDSDTIVIENNHPAIIDRQTFDAVQRRLAERRTATTPHHNGGGFVFTGIAKCAKCGGSLCGYTSRGCIRYRCQTHAILGTCETNACGQAELLNAVLGAIESRFRNPQTADRLRTILSRKLKQRTSRVTADDLRKQLTKVDTQLSTARRNMALAGSDGLRIEYEAVVQDLRAERERLDALIQDAQKPRNGDDEAIEQRVTKLTEMLCQLRATTLAVPVPKQRELLATIIDKIEVRSTQSGGTQTRWDLTSAKIYLRADMWVDEGVNLSGSSTSTRSRPEKPFRRGRPATRRPTSGFWRRSSVRAARTERTAGWGN